LDTIHDILYPGRRAPVTPINDDIQAAGDNLRNLIESDLIVKDPPPAGWAPNPKDLA
jgi:hypothetical protein